MIKQTNKYRQKPNQVNVVPVYDAIKKYKQTNLSGNFVSKLVPEARNRKGMRVELELGQFCSGSRGNLNYYLLIQKETILLVNNGNKTGRHAKQNKIF